MKRIISALLVIVMLAAMITVPTVTVTAAVESKPWTNTSDLFDTDAPMLYATKVPADATIDVTDGEMEEVWKNAYTLRVDRSQNVIRTNDKWKQSTFIDVYVMWDDANLYILEDRQYDDLTYASGKLNHYSGVSASAYYFSLPIEFSSDGVENDGAAYMIGAMAANATAVGTAVKGVGTQRTKYYKGNTNATFFGDIGWAANNNVETYTTLTETGFMMETKIPWTELDAYNPGFSAAVDTVLGFSFQYNTKSSGGQSNYNHKQVADTYGFQQLKLVTTNETITPARPDVSWYTANPSATTFYINDADDLLGWVELTQSHGSSPFAKDLGISGVGPNFAGKKVILTADIHFNANTTFNADGTYTGADPVNGWGTIRDFAGEFDGQGHTISGLYAPIGYYQANDARYMGFFGRLQTGASVHDISFTNGYLHNKDYNTTDNSKTGVGTLASVLHGDNADNKTTTLTNIYSDVAIKGDTDLCGGILGSTWSASYNFNAALDNVVYAGVVTKGVGSGGTGLSSRLVLGTRGTSTTKNCYVKAGAEKVSVTQDVSDAAFIQATDVEDEKFSVRILGMLKETELALDSVGMKVTVTYNTNDPKSNTLEDVTTVYEKVYASGELVDFSATGYDYAYGVVIEDLPAAASDTVKIDVVLTRVVDGVEVESTCTYTTTYVAGLN